MIRAAKIISVLLICDELISQIRRYSTQPVKKSPSAIRITSLILLTTGGLYAGAGYIALHNPEYKKMWIENVPGGETSLEYIQKYEKEISEIDVEKLQKQSIETYHKIEKGVCYTMNYAVNVSKTAYESVSRGVENLKGTKEKGITVYEDAHRKISGVYDSLMKMFDSSKPAEVEPKKPVDVKYSEKDVNEAAIKLQEAEKSTIKVIATSIDNVTAEAEKIADKIKSSTETVKNEVEVLRIKTKQIVDDVLETLEAEANKLSKEAKEKSIKEIRYLGEVILRVLDDQGAQRVQSVKGNIEEHTKSIKSVLDTATEQYRTLGTAIFTLAQHIQNSRLYSTQDFLKVEESFDFLLKEFKTFVDDDTKRIQQLVEQARMAVIDSVKLDELAKKRLLQKQKDELDEKHSNELRELNDKLITEYNTSMQSALANQEKIFKESYERELKKQRESLDEFWRLESEKLVSQERKGRLDRVDGLAMKIEIVESLIRGYMNVLEESDYLRNLDVAVRSLKGVMGRSRKTGFDHEFKALVNLSGKEEFVDVILSSVDESVAREGVSMLKDLKEHYEQVSKIVRKIQFMPEDGGPVSFIISNLVSYLMFSKKGLVRGNDVEAILARTGYYLDLGDVDQAAREFNQLRGRWLREAGRDWLQEARKYLVVRQAATVLDTHVSLMNTGFLRR